MAAKFKDANALNATFNKVAATRRNTSGEISGVVRVGQDITELSQARVEQERIADELTQYIDTANAPFIGIDADGSISELNRSVAEITGYSKDEVMGHDLVSKLVPVDCKDAVREAIYKALLGEKTANFEFPLFAKSGERVDILLNLSSRRNASGEIIGVVGVGYP